MWHGEVIHGHIVHPIMCFQYLQKTWHKGLAKWFMYSRFISWDILARSPWMCLSLPIPTCVCLYLYQHNLIVDLNIILKLGNIKILQKLSSIERIYESITMMLPIYLTLKKSSDVLEFVEVVNEWKLFEPLLDELHGWPLNIGILE